MRTRRDAKQRPPHWRRRVDHRLRETHDIHLARVGILQRLAQDAPTPGKTIEPAHLKGVPRPQVVETCQPLRPIGDAARFAVIDEDALTAGRAELSGVRVRVLLALRDSGVADFMCHAEQTAETCG